MKMIVSDYDNTFYINDEDIKKNIYAVKLFMKNNYFVIATGRSYYDFKNKKDLYGISSNYLIINHGATILKDDKVIYNYTIDNSVKDKLIKDLNMKSTVSHFACSGIDSRVTLDNNDLTKIQVKYKTKEEAKVINDMLIKKYSDNVNSFFVCNGEAIEIVSKDIDKSKSIAIVAELENILKDNIYTIGDGHSDIKMVKEYNGYTMINSIEELKDIAIKEYESVSDLIFDVMNNNY